MFVFVLDIPKVWPNFIDNHVSSSHTLLVKIVKENCSEKTAGVSETKFPTFPYILLMC